MISWLKVVASRPGRRPPRRGFTMLEVEISFVLLGIGLAGLAPLVMMQLRQVRKLELRFQGQVFKGGVQMLPNPDHNLPARTYLLVPWTDQWARKLSARGQVQEFVDPAQPPTSFTFNKKTTRNVSLAGPPVVVNDSTVSLTIKVSQK